MEGNMFCYQCQEAAKGTGCVLRGVCGKKDTTARYMDLLLFVVRGVSVAADTLRTKGYEVEAGTNELSPTHFSLQLPMPILTMKVSWLV